MDPIDAMTPEVRTKIARIAAAQRAINFCVLGYFAAVFVFNQVRVWASWDVAKYVGIALGAGVVLAGLYYAHKMAASLAPLPVAILCDVLMLVPLVNVIVLLILSSRATSKLRAAGLTVGALGVDDLVMRKLNGEAIPSYLPR